MTRRIINCAFDELPRNRLEFEVFASNPRPSLSRSPWAFEPWATIAVDQSQTAVTDHRPASATPKSRTWSPAAVVISSTTSSTGLWFRTKRSSSSLGSCPYRTAPFSETNAAS